MKLVREFYQNISFGEDDIVSYSIKEKIYFDDEILWGKDSERTINEIM